MTTFVRMTQFGGNKPSGPQGFLQKTARFGLVIIGLVVGGFVLLLTASAALIVVTSIVFLAAFIFAGFWLRAKLFGKPIGGQAFQDLKDAAKAQQDAQKEFMNGLHTQADMQAGMEGDVLDAHRTPDGWTVDEP